MRGAAIVGLICTIACSFTVAPATSTGDGGPSSDAEATSDAAIDVTTVDACANCPMNDIPGGAIQISGTNTISVDTTNAHDDFAVSCGTPGGRDLFYELLVPTDQIVYIDTETSTFDAAAALYPGACTAIGSEALECSADGCPPSTLSQIARSLTAGTYCLVVDEGTASAGETLVVEVTYLNRPGTELTGTSPFLASGDTCGATDLYDPVCERGPTTAPGTAKDHLYFLPFCGTGAKTFTASTCVTIGYDSIVAMFGRFGAGQCVDDQCPSGDGSLVSGSFTGPGIMRFVVDGWNGECGTYNLSVSVTPWP